MGVEGLWRPKHVPGVGTEGAQRDEVEEEEEHLSISQLETRREGVEPAESIIHFTMVDRKVKAPETPSNKPQKKMKQTKAFA